MVKVKTTATNIFKKLPTLLLGIIVILAIRYNTGLISFGQAEVQEVVSLETMRSIIPDAAAFEKDVYKDKWSKIYDVKGRTIGSYTTSKSYADHITGYLGPVPVLIVVDRDEIVLGVEPLANRETPRYISVIQSRGFFSLWNGVPASGIPQYEVDTIAGATMTTRAVIEGISLRMSDFYGKTDGITDRRISWRSVLSSIAGYLFLGFALLSYFVKKIRRHRIFLMVSSVLILGVLKGEMLSLFFFYNLITGGWTIGLISSIGIIALLSIILPLITGRSFYCHFVCPFGAAQELLSKAGHRIVLSKKVRSRLKNIRYIWFGLLAVVIVLGVSFDLSLVEPFSIFNYQTAHTLTVVLSLITAFASLFFHRPWCNFICPTGQMLDLLKTRKS